LAVHFGFIKLSKAIAKIGGLGNLCVYSGIAQAHEEFYVVVWIIVGVNIDPHQVLPTTALFAKHQSDFRQVAEPQAICAFFDGIVCAVLRRRKRHLSGKIRIGN
jgi:hypothetical protein